MNKILATALMILLLFYLGSLTLIICLDLYAASVYYFGADQEGSVFIDTLLYDPFIRSFSMVKAPFLKDSTHMDIVAGGYLNSALYRAWFFAALTTAAVFINGVLVWLFPSFVEIFDLKLDIETFKS